MENDKRARIDYIDFAKGIGIISVIIGHMGIWGIEKIIYSFHMPMFFVIAGVFVSQKYSNIEYIKRKSGQLLIPYIFTSFALIFLSVIKNFLKGTFDNISSDAWRWFTAALFGSGNLELYGFTRIGAIWFLLAIFIACVFVRFIIDKKNAAIYVFLISTMGYLLSKIIWLPLSIESAMVASAYVYIGYLAHKHRIMEINPTWRSVIVIATLWLITILFGEINMAKNLYKGGIFSFAGSLCAVYLILKICKIIDERKIFPVAVINTLSFYGRNSLVVLCFHLLDLEMFPWSRLQKLFLGAGGSHLLFLVVELTIKLLISALAVLIVKRVRILQKIFTVVNVEIKN